MSAVVTLHLKSQRQSQILNKHSHSQKLLSKMIALPTLVLGLALSVVNTAGLPAESKDLETRQTTTDMTNQITSYITALVNAGFKPNGTPTTKRDVPNAVEMEKRATTPVTPASIKLVISLLEQHGFQPAATSIAHKRDEELTPEPLKHLMKRTLPDINLLITVLKQHGFYPTKAASKTTRDLSKRQSSSDINTVITELMSAGYDPGAFGPAAANLYLSTLKTETTASCPKDNATLYTTGSSTYEIFCGRDYPGNDLPFIHTTTLAACLASCASYVPSKSVANGAGCIAASWGAGTTTGNCYRKYNIGNTNYFNAPMSVGRNKNNL